jgi:hypothetical protein
VVFIYNGILLSHREEILSFASKWIELENIILSEVDQTQKAKNRMFSLICRLQIQNKCNNIIGHGSHRRLPTEGIEQRKKTKNLNVADVLFLQE